MRSRSYEVIQVDYALKGLIGLWRCHHQKGSRIGKSEFLTEPKSLQGTFSFGSPTIIKMLLAMLTSSHKAEFETIIVAAEDKLWKLLETIQNQDEFDIQEEEILRTLQEADDQVSQ